MTIAGLALAAAVSCLLGCVVVVLALVVVRVLKDRTDRRRAHLRGPVWLQVLVLTTGEAVEAEAAAQALRRVPRPGREAVVDHAFALVPKLRGDARERLRHVLRGWGLHDESRSLAASRSVVRRCRGIHRLGVLADPGTLADVVAALDDRAFSVQRTALLALGAYHDASVVSAALDRAVASPRLRRDFLATMDRIGAAAAPVLSDALSGATEDDEEWQRRGHLAAEALGLVGAISAVPVLAKVLATEHGQVGDELRMACLEALGELGVPSSTGVVVRHLRHGSDDVRRTAARALGRIGGATPLSELAEVLEDPNVEVARAAAQSLQRCGPVGMEVLRQSPAPVAREALALASLAATSS